MNCRDSWLPGHPLISYNIRESIFSLLTQNHLTDHEMEQELWRTSLLFLGRTKLPTNPHCVSFPGEYFFLCRWIGQFLSSIYCAMIETTLYGCFGTQFLLWRRMGKLSGADMSCCQMIVDNGITLNITFCEFLMFWTLCKVHLNF